MNDNIILIGFMGSGKTTIGKRLAKLLEYSFVDTDQLIEKKQGMMVRDIFSQKGERYFRQLETDTISEMVQTCHKTIISSGGGLPLRECNVKILQELGFVIMLDVSKETVIKRLEGDTTRPLLQGDNVDEKVEELLTYREPLYELAAHMKVPVNGRTIQDIAEEIIRNYQTVRNGQHPFDVEDRKEAENE
ncbi:MAG: shikimate kinase [Clostridiales bacterium]|nr:shikimate kinase [Clostridiales bacterium]